MDGNKNFHNFPLYSILYSFKIERYSFNAINLNYSSMYLLLFNINYINLSQISINILFFFSFKLRSYGSILFFQLEKKTLKFIFFFCYYFFCLLAYAQQFFLETKRESSFQVAGRFGKMNLWKFQWKNLTRLVTRSLNCPVFLHF